MVSRSRVAIGDIAALDNLSAAFFSAARGKQGRAEVRMFATDLDGNLERLRREILSGVPQLGDYRQFVIHDPKRRVIHAPAFRERVLHHALVAVIGPVLDKSLVDDTYACRVGRGPVVAVRRAQQQAQRWPWYGKVDVRRYFDSIDHGVLGELLQRRFKDRGLLALCRAVIASYCTNPGRGLPIGALTSQHFANFYLGPLDRFLLETVRVRAMVRYMDDVVLWSVDRVEAVAALGAATAFVRERLHLEWKPNARIQQSRLGLSFLGFRVFPHRLLLLRRRRRRYITARARWERAFALGLVDGQGLQQGYASALAITAHAGSTAMRRAQLRVRPAPDV